MKKITYLLTAGVLLIILTTIGCSKDDGGGLSEEQEQTAALVGIWNAVSVNDGTPRDDYGDFSITITESNYTTSGGPDLLPLPKTATWGFGTTIKTALIFQPGGVNKAVTYSISSDGKLTLSFTHTGAGFDNSRENSVEGSWVMTFTKS